jgi:formylglycine-generating enzyme required for sulfatase activity
LVVQGLWGGDPKEMAEKQRISALIEQLGHSSFVQREAAIEQLQQTGKQALPALRAAAANHADLEIQQRAAVAMEAILLRFGRSKSTGLELMLIKSGDFEMGSPLAENGRALDETQHRVRLTRDFLLGAFEVTQDQYRQVMKVNPSWFQSKAGGEAKVTEYETGNFPVESVTWFDAVAFCNQLSLDDGDEPYYELADIERKGDSIKSATVTIRGGSGYRLPTEAEWEYACRAGTTTAFHFGAAGGNGNSSNIKGVTMGGGYGGPIVGPNLERTAKVGSYRPNHWGLFDMHGNVAEWCWDWYEKDYYASSPENDPAGPRTGTHRVLRGGSWLVGEASSRSASRLMHTPGESAYFGGFRVARSP